MLNTIKILGVKVTNESEKNILEHIFILLYQAKKRFYIITPNPEILVYANKHLDYKNKLNDAEVSLPDGTGVFLASVLQGKFFKERVPGVDFIEKVCQYSEKNPISMGFLGGRRGVAERAVNRLKKKYPYLNITFVGSEWQNSLKFNPSASLRTGVQSSKLDKKSNHIDILFVAFGFPKQEEWIVKNLDHLPVTAAMGVGGAFDYISGEVIRAPYLIRAIGFEWLFRLIRQPWRFRRQLALFQFIFLVIKERIEN